MSERILIVRLSAIGDVVMASGLIPALRARWPDAQISWLTEPTTVPLLRHNAQLHEVIPWPRAVWQQLWKEHRYAQLWAAMRGFRAELRARRFDLMLDAQGLLKSGLLGWLAGAPRRVGLLSREGSQWLMTERVGPREGDDPRMSHEYRDLADYLGAPTGSFQLDLAVGDGPREAARVALAAAGVPVGPAGRFAVLAPFTTRPQKHWFEDRWAALAGALRAEGLVPVLMGGPSDREAAARIAAACPTLVNLVGQLKLDETVAAIADSALLVGVDTGLTHMGTALNVPTVGLFGSTRPYLDTGSPRTAILYEPMDCSPCRRHPTCGGAFHCMRHWTVELVMAQARQQLQVGDA
ncbi:MAG TPA: glycosyltransferase family 9 protein [Ideonella sp.]|uniref:glycosyltransferase family 9 protein n=1 Tax=Ideonella sp. TaxID=1929293 RepID=UPI002E2F1F19|nr:glycosyltransferase family 9 protein [Ideonella sp.]HEX5683900.1 glycosyltransferase family 9 protein [Ideonella sp.]